jgi:hypothetical protein
VFVDVVVDGEDEGATGVGPATGPEYVGPDTVGVARVVGAAGTIEHIGAIVAGVVSPPIFIEFIVMIV